MSREDASSDNSRPDSDLQDVFDQLDELEHTVDSSEERHEVQRARQMLKRLPGSDRIKKYTSRDIAEGFVGGIIFSLPLLVEDGVFEIAEWFLEFYLGPIPIFLAINILFVVGIVAGLLYYTDIREVKEPPLFGFIPKRLVAILSISFIVALVTMFMWGRLNEPVDGVDPTTLEQFARVTVIWAAAALGATLGDILPGESQGEDLAEMIRELGDGDETNNADDSA